MLIFLGIFLLKDQGISNEELRKDKKPFIKRGGGTGVNRVLSKYTPRPGSFILWYLAKEGHKSIEFTLSLNFRKSWLLSSGGRKELAS